MAALASWAREYIGIPFEDRASSHEGSDCWGLLKLVLAEQFGITVDDYEERPNYATSPQVLEEIRCYGQMQLESHQWIPISMHKVRAGDGILLSIAGLPAHVGIAIGNNCMLHIEKHIDACRENYTEALWKNRVLGAYRHADLIG